MFYLVLIGLGSCLFQAVDLFCWGIAGKKVNIDELAKTSAMTTCLGAGTHIGTQWKVTSYVAWGLCAPHIGCTGATLQHICKLKLLGSQKLMTNVFMIIPESITRGVSDALMVCLLKRIHPKV